MDCMPVPEGSWQESYNKQQKKWNLMLAASIVAFGVTYYTVRGITSVYIFDNFSRIKRWPLTLASYFQK